MPPRTPLPLLLAALLAGFAVSAPAALRAQAPAIAQFTSGMQSQEGFVPVHLDPETGKVFLEIARFGEDVLYLNALATGLGSARAFRLDAGGGGDEAVVRFERRGPRVVMVRRNTNVTATSGDPGQVGGAEKSFPVSVLASMPIVARSGERVLVDATDFFLSDAAGVAQDLQRRGEGTFRLDRDRSVIHLPRTKAFPENTEVEASLTFASDAPGGEIRRHTPDGRALTLRQHHSLVQLPPPGYEPRRHDPRVGIFGVSFYDFGKSFDQDYQT
ncbi:MAG: DUF5117 domain-containing protein, partial [Gemmatimonadetes bacterium]|nr:DUF5117 domain-containing protein [Gemmatimonadota bacterium]